MDRAKAEIAILKPDIDRVLAAVSYIIHLAETSDVLFTQYDVVKSMFLADRAHLNKYGRLISSDNYVAMIHGPVASVAYDLLKQNPLLLRKFGIKTLPWKMDKGQNGKNTYHSSDVTCIDDILSPSDKKLLEWAVATIQSLDFGQIRRLTHEDKAYLDAWEDEGSRKQYQMSLGLLFDNDNFDRARELSDLSRL
jgi:uncharacterized phage-associated protein